MNKEWSEMNKKMQQLLKKNTFDEGIEQLLLLRETLMEEMLSWKEKLSRDDFDAIPYINADGYHSKTVAYSIWHIMRIEDIVVNTLIRNKEEVFFEHDFQKRTHSPIITTGNELRKMEIAEFSKQLDLDQLYEYMLSVKTSTDEWLKTLQFDDLKIKYAGCESLITDLNVISTDEEAFWLIDYWCGKDLKGLIQMPMSRHWIMHIEAANRIIDKIKK